MPKILLTSLNEIKSFVPCPEGWKNILKGQNKAQSDSIEFPLIDCLKSNSFSDICWLLGKREKEIICAINAAKMCANSVKGLKSSADADAATYADADAATYAVSACAAAAVSAAAASASGAAYAASASSVYASGASAYASGAAYASVYAAAASAASEEQTQKNKNFLFQAIKNYQQSL